LYENILVLANFNQVIIPLLGITLYFWILYTLDEKESPLPKNSFPTIVSQLPGVGQKIGQIML
jgi:hypothetical protein